MSLFKKAFVAAVFTMASSHTFVSAQDFFFSFDEFSRQSTLTQSSPAAGGPATGQLFIFSDASLDFNNIDLDFTVDNPGVASFTRGVPADSDFSFTSIRVGELFVGVPLFANAPVPITPTDGQLDGIAIVGIGNIDFFNDGQNPFDRSDAEFRAGANGFLLATIDYSVAGPGQANFDFILGEFGIVDDFFGPLAPDFAGSTGTLTVVGVPEPSSAILLMLSAAGMVARRRRP